MLSVMLCVDDDEDIEDVGGVGSTEPLVTKIFAVRKYFVVLPPPCCPCHTFVTDGAQHRNQIL